MLDMRDLSRLVESISDSDYFTNHGPAARRFEERLSELLDCSVASVSDLFVASAMVAVGRTEVTWDSVSDYRIKYGVNLALRNIPRDSDTSNYSFVEYDLRSSQDFIVNRRATATIAFVLNPFDRIKQLKEIIACHFATVISHEAGEKVDTFTGASILSTDQTFIDRMRNIRSSYGVDVAVPVPVTSNGRFSEVQALQGLTCLENSNFCT